MNDYSKMDELKKRMVRKRILKDDEIPLRALLLSIVNMPRQRVGLIYMELCNMQENFIAKLFVDIIEGYHFLPDMARKLKDKAGVVTGIIRSLLPEWRKYTSK